MPSIGFCLPQDCVTYRFLIPVFQGDTFREEEPWTTGGCIHHRSDAGYWARICSPASFTIILSHSIRALFPFRGVLSLKIVGLMV
ncbi:hypothetical protein ARMGADRAFT_816769 [Armillaria gallica]|uniref:Uncharacterized protein n=1 Tax=Armillaria gallica TaxID=47427 RepID=A0A2H3CD58_ARMGA|nr:hypothetical protein ARMGADRAFT_816769 [Armillaria gallica]